MIYLNSSQQQWRGVTKRACAMLGLNPEAMRDAARIFVRARKWAREHMLAFPARSFSEFWRRYKFENIFDPPEFVKRFLAQGVLGISRLLHHEGQPRFNPIVVGLNSVPAIRRNQRRAVA